MNCPHDVNWTFLVHCCPCCLSGPQKREVSASHDSLQSVTAECEGKKGKHHLVKIDSGSLGLKRNGLRPAAQRSVMFFTCLFCFIMTECLCMFCFSKFYF